MRKTLDELIDLHTSAIIVIDMQLATSDEVLAVWHSKTNTRAVA